MKRAAPSLLVTGAVPLAILFALMARPALLHAEAGVVIMCTDPAFDPCVGKASGDSCADAGASERWTCVPLDCFDDAGTSHSALECMFTGALTDAGDAGDSGHARSDASDAGSDASEMADAANAQSGDAGVVNPSPRPASDAGPLNDAGGSSGNPDDAAGASGGGCGCRLAPDPAPHGLLGLFAGALLAFAAAWRARSKKRNRVSK